MFKIVQLYAYDFSLLIWLNHEHLLQLRELKNGRLAMIAIAGMLVAESTNGTFLFSGNLNPIWSMTHYFSILLIHSFDQFIYLLFLMLLINSFTTSPFMYYQVWVLSKCGKLGLPVLSNLIYRRLLLRLNLNYILNLIIK